MRRNESASARAPFLLPSKGHGGHGVSRSSYGRPPRADGRPSLLNKNDATSDVTWELAQGPVATRCRAMVGSSEEAQSCDYLAHATRNQAHLCLRNMQAGVGAGASAGPSPVRNSAPYAPTIRDRLGGRPRGTARALTDSVPQNYSLQADVSGRGAGQG